MGKEHQDFLNDEYRALWKEHGIDDVKLPPSSRPSKPSRVKAPAPAKTVTKIEVKAKQSPRSGQPKLSTLEEVSTWIGDCRRCGLCEARNKIVFGSGNPRAKLLFIGEGPGADEDKQGLPFVGRAGQLLTKIIEAMGYQRSEVYIANIVKCRPPGNRVPQPEEVAQCLPFLKAQIDLINPELAVALGSTAAVTLTGITTSMGSLRGKFHSIAWKPELAIMPTYHPAYLLRNPAAKKIVWEDMKLVKARLEKKA